MRRNIYSEKLISIIKELLNIYNILATWCEELAHWKRPWCWERLKAGEGDDRGWDGWMASLTWWTWVWVNSRSWWWTRKPGVAKVLELQLQHPSVQWTLRTAFLYDGLVGSPCSPRNSQESSPIPQLKSINSSALSFLYSPTLTSVHDYWKNHSFD